MWELKWCLNKAIGIGEKAFWLRRLHKDGGDGDKDKDIGTCGIFGVECISPFWFGDGIFFLFLPFLSPSCLVCGMGLLSIWFFSLLSCPVLSYLALSYPILSMTWASIPSRLFVIILIYLSIFSRERGL